MALTEANFDLDLSGYFTQIDDIQVNEHGLFVKGKKGVDGLFGSNQ